MQGLGELRKAGDKGGMAAWTVQMGVVGHGGHPSDRRAHGVIVFPLPCRWHGGDWCKGQQPVNFADEVSEGDL